MGTLHTIANIPDCDGAQIAQIAGSGRQDIAACRSTVVPTIYWEEQGATPDTWTQHTVANVGTKIEGIDAEDYNGDGEIEIVSLDQSDGIIRIHKPVVFGNPQGAWNTVNLLAGRPNLQDSQSFDIDGDGDPEIIYTWEGNGAGSGGVNWLDWTGGDVMNPANWADHVMVQHEGAWWLASSGPIDLNADGRDDVVFTARDNRNPAPVPGVYWLEKPAVVANPWTLHVIDNTSQDWLHCDLGDFSGDGNDRDVISFAYAVAQSVTWFRFSDSWRAYQLNPPAVGLNGYWNIRKAQTSSGDRDDILFIVSSAGATGGIYVYEWNGCAYVPCKVLDIAYAHPMDDRVIWVDLTGDGVEDAIIPDSGGDRLIWLDFD